MVHEAILAPEVGSTDPAVDVVTVRDPGVHVLIGMHSERAYQH